MPDSFSVQFMLRGETEAQRTEVKRGILVTQMQIKCHCWCSTRCFLYRKTKHAHQNFLICHPFFQIYWRHAQFRLTSHNMLAKIPPLGVFFNMLMSSSLPLDLCLDSLDHSSRKRHPPVLVPGLAPLAKFSSTVTKPQSWTQTPWR